MDDGTMITERMIDYHCYCCCCCYYCYYCSCSCSCSFSYSCCYCCSCYCSYSCFCCCYLFHCCCCYFHCCCITVKPSMLFSLIFQRIWGSINQKLRFSTCCQHHNMPYLSQLYIGLISTVYQSKSHL